MCWDGGVTLCSTDFRFGGICIGSFLSRRAFPSRFVGSTPSSTSPIGSSPLSSSSFLFTFSLLEPGLSGPAVSLSGLGFALQRRIECCNHWPCWSLVGKNPSGDGDACATLYGLRKKNVIFIRLNLEEGRKEKSMFDFFDAWNGWLPQTASRVWPWPWSAHRDRKVPDNNAIVVRIPSQFVSPAFRPKTMFSYHLNMSSMVKSSCSYSSLWESKPNCVHWKTAKSTPWCVKVC